MRALDERLTQVIPSERQIQLQQMEFYAFIHFTVNTFTDREWGNGSESPAIFNPERLNARQWAQSISEAGMRGMILTCKHHDGFCLWPSRHTEHSVKASSYKGGRGDVVEEAAEVCREYNLKFGVYLSPWDRNHPLYGSGKPYNDFFVAQLEELLTGYGEIFSVWFDGACGEGPNGKKQFYDWERYYETIRRLQPGACIHVCGPDIRWCGNEAGQTRQSEWSVVPRRTADTEKVASQSQQHDDADFRMRPIRAQDQDLGSRKLLADETDLIWYPAEVNTSIRPGWFWHESENDKVRPLKELIDIYEKSVGGNATFLLNIPPTRDGLFHENDVRRLKEFGEYLRKSYGTNLVGAACLSACASSDGHSVENIRIDNEAYYMPEPSDGETFITVEWPQEKNIRRVVLKEQIRLSQRVEHFLIDIMEDGEWKTISEGTVVGHKRIVSFEPVQTMAIRIRITDSRLAPAIRFLGIYA